jgi:tetratricopeptide (TPR) repeat protein
MKYQRFTILLTLLLTACSSTQDCPENINILPMYGKEKKCQEQIDIDQDFFKECDKIFKNRKEASSVYTKKAWGYFYKNDFDTAMKRFNQAWLLDSLNAETYWGFGNILGMQMKPEESLTYFNKSLKINPNNSNVWLGLGISHGQIFFKTKDQHQLEKTIEYLKKAIQLDSKNILAYAQLTGSYSYFMEKDSALKYLELTDKLDSNAINQEVREVLKEK